MQTVYRINRISNSTQGLEESHLNSVRTAISEALQTLIDNPCPDMFLGRKSQEPFPHEDCP